MRNLGDYRREKSRRLYSVWLNWTFGLVRTNGVVCGNDGESFRENRIREKRDRAVVIEAEEAMEVFCERERERKRESIYLVGEMKAEEGRCRLFAF